MRPTIIIAVVLMALVPSLAVAQQAGENINVLPVVVPDTNGDGEVNGLDDPAWYIKGDGYLQRQVEPTIAASTRNPDHLLAFFVDYRAVDIPDDVGLGEETVMIAMFNTTRTIMMAVSQLSFPRLPHMEMPPIAASEAWIGMSRSYDGGLTWSGGFLPGAPFDTGDGGNLITPIDGLEAATDPVLAPGPCGKFYLVFMAFTRGGESKLVVTRYQDHNYAGGGEHIQWDRIMTVAESGNNAEYGYFLDKPDIEVDIARYPGAEICADQVNISYSTFNGFTNDGKFQSKINFAYSTDSAETFTKQKLNPPYKQNQGSALAIDPNDGTIYMVWRHFNDPDAILMTKSVNGGVKWSKPVVVTENTPLAAFDQPSISLSAAQLAVPGSYPTDQAYLDLYPNPENEYFPEVAFRSNGFPTAVVTDGKLFVAWQERVDIDPDSDFYGQPFQYGSPRIVVVHSDDQGGSWKDIDGSELTRQAIDVGRREDGTIGHRDDGTFPIPTDGFGALPDVRSPGPQVQPKLVALGGQLLVAYVESRGRIARYGTGNETIVPADLSPLNEGWISGYDRLMDVRAALLDPDNGRMLSTFQVSRYPIRADAEFGNGEDLQDVAPINWPCYPDSENIGDPICIRQVNRFNAVQSAAGSTPFMGDYIDVAPAAQFVFDGTKWKWATDPADVPAFSFHTIFSDNRHLLPPLPASPPTPLVFDEWNYYDSYSPPYSSSCENAGSRNTDVLTSRIDASFVLSAPTTYKKIDDLRGFPFTVKNNTGDSRLYNVTVAVDEPDDLIDPDISFNRADDHWPIHSFVAEIFPHSTSSFMIYGRYEYLDPIRVRVTEDCGLSDCPTSVLTLNSNSGGYDQPPALGSPDKQWPEMDKPFHVVVDYPEGTTENPFVINPFVINTSPENPFVINPFVINPFVINPFVINPFVINPFVINPSLADETDAVVDTTWTISPGESNSPSSYFPLVNIDNAQNYLANGYSFQLIIYKGSLYGGLEGCESNNVPQPQILSNFYQAAGAENPFVINPFVINPFVINPFVINPFVINSTFTMSPSEETPDETTKAPPASDEVKITLRAFKPKLVTTEGANTNSTSENLALLKEETIPPDPIDYLPWEDPPSLVIVPLPCLNDTSDDEVCRMTTIAPDLIPENVQFATPPEPVRVGDSVFFPDSQWAVRNVGSGDATAENGPLQHGFYLCPTVPAEGTELDITTCKEFEGPEQKHISEENPLAKDLSEDFGPIELTIPTITSDTWPVGQFLVVYVDELRQVSEFNEVNNWAAFSITIDEPNSAPEIVLTGHVLAEDPDRPVAPTTLATDADDDPMTITVTAGPTSGTLNDADANGIIDSTDGTFVYTPDADFNGNDSFAFTVTDEKSQPISGTVNITVNPVNDIPIASDASFVTDENTPVSGTVSVEDVDDTVPDQLTFEIVVHPSNGTAGIDNMGLFTYTPNSGFDGEDTFTYGVTDRAGASATGVVTITVNDTISDGWLFIGFDNPWETNYTMGVGSTIPLKWRYADPVTGQTVSSFSDPLPITATRYPSCSNAGEPEGTADEEPITLPGEDAGNSTLRYVNGDWQLNWDTSNQGVGCYVLTISHPSTGQTDTQNADGENLTIVLQ